MSTFDWQRVTDTLGPTPENLRIRLGSVVSVQDDRTITVTIAGSSTQIAGVKYLAHVQPDPGTPVWLMTDGVDLFAFGVLAASGGRTFAPRVARTSTQAIATAGFGYTVTFDTAISDAWGAWSSSDPTKLTAKITGRYQAVGQVTFAADATGSRALTLFRNGTTTVGRQWVASLGGGNTTTLNVCSVPFDMTAGDYITMIVFQNSGGNLNIVNDSTFGISMGLIYLGT